MNVTSVGPQNTKPKPMAAHDVLVSDWAQQHNGHIDDAAYNNYTVWYL